MKILIIRHGDPDYEHDSLTETGWAEASLLAERLYKTEDIKEFYVSPMGRAQDTASLTLKKFGKAAVTLPWLREFNEALINRPDVKDQKKISWDWLPQDWTAEPLFYDAVHCFGDISHLYAGGRSSSFSARFAEVYGNGDRLD